MNHEWQLLFFRLRETSGTEGKSLPCRFRRIQVNIYQSYCYLFIVIMYFSGYPIFYDQWALSPQSLSAIYLYFALTVARNRKFPYANRISYD